MLEPYEDEPENLGILAMSAEEIAEVGARAYAGRIALAVHAIGDRANREAIEGLARIRGRAFPSVPLRHRIEHVQLLHEEDIPKLASNHIIASMQPIHATSDMGMADRHWGKRCRSAYAWKSLLGAGATLAFGSDAPVESPDPFRGLHAALTRRRVDGSPGPEGWIPQERLTLREALTAYLRGPAYAAGMEREVGRLAIGSFADLIVLDQEIFEIPPDALAEIRPVGTMVAGSWKWREF
jgi:predicted amidohydrolase YtcJ